MSSKKNAFDPLAEISSAPCGFHYSLDAIILSIRLVVFGLLSLRGTGRALSFFSAWFNGGMPCHVVVQNWIMRLGIYRLGRPLEKRDDWIFILDHTIDFGTKKCLVVLGVTVEKFTGKKCRLNHEDMRVLEISIVEKATAKSVEETLCKIAGKTGTPVQIVSDKGSNIKRGVADFIKNHPGARHTYDVTHKSAILMKHHLKNDTRWKALTKKMWMAKRDILFTSLGFMVPPKPKEKSRWLNLDIYLEWLGKALEFRKSNPEAGEAKIFDEKLGWIGEFAGSLPEWRSMLDMLDMLKKEINTNGFRKGSAVRFEKLSSGIVLSTKRLRTLKKEIMEYIEEETSSIEDKRALLGSSDIIESVFGRYKGFSGKTPMKEVGRAVLTIPVFTEKLEAAEVKAAMESVSAKDVDDWLRQNIGESFFSKRKSAFSLTKTNSNNFSVKYFSDNLKKVASF